MTVILGSVSIVTKQSDNALLNFDFPLFEHKIPIKFSDPYAARNHYHGHVQSRYHNCMNCMYTFIIL